MIFWQKIQCGWVIRAGRQDQRACFCHTGGCKRQTDWVITIAPSATVYETIERMVNNNVGAIIISDQGRPCGIFTERDLLNKLIGSDRDLDHTSVADVMTANPEALPVDAFGDELFETVYSLDALIAQTPAETF